MLQQRRRQRWVVARFGASMHYAVPRMLYRAGLLARFYTDFYAGPTARRLLSLVPPGWRNPTIDRALGRFAPDLPMELVRSYTMLGLEYAVLQRLLRNSESLSELFLRMGDRFGSAVAQDGFAGADGLYCFNTAALSAFRVAKERGMRCVLEQNIAPRAVEEVLLAEEQKQFPGWEIVRQRGPATAATIERERAEWELADLIICPSEFVREGVISAGGGAHKCSVLPYGVDDRFSPIGRQAHGGPLRVLAVGQVNLRKGAGYAREVGRMLGNSVELRWVGPISLTEEGRRKMREHVTLTGAIPRSQIFEQFRWADVFFLPSVCEGSATVTYEALMSGLPVVTTPNAGSIVADGINGFLVPIRDTIQMAEKLRLLGDDAGLRRRMQEEAAATSGHASLEAYQGRLLRSLEFGLEREIAV
jgi:hypothetical protein